MMLMEYKRRAKQVRRRGGAAVLEGDTPLRSFTLSPRPTVWRPFFFRIHLTMLRTQPSLPITGTLASDDEGSGSGDDLSVDQFHNNIVALPVLVPAQAALAPPAAPIELAAPLPVYEDRGGVAAGPPAPHGGEMGAPIAAPAHAPHSVSARGDPAPGAFAPHLAAAQAPPTLAGRPLGANWWEGGGGDERALNPAGSPPLHLHPSSRARFRAPHSPICTTRSSHSLIGRRPLRCGARGGVEEEVVRR